MTKKLSSLPRRKFLTLATAFALPGRASSKGNTRNQDRTDLKLRLTFAENIMVATLYDNTSARDFASMLPLDLKIEDYGTNEKIAHLPRKLKTEGHGPFDNEQPYDLCYYMPWGNLAMFFADYEHPGLIRLGRFDQGFEALHISGTFPLRIERIQ